MKRTNGALLFVGLLACCTSVPPAVDAYVKNDLPKRSGTSYAPLLPELRGELVLQDAVAACSVALAEGAKETDAPACVCAHATGSDWQQKCATWTGATSGAGSDAGPSDAGASPDAHG